MLLIKTGDFGFSALVWLKHPICLRDRFQQMSATDVLTNTLLN